MSTDLTIGRDYRGIAVVTYWPHVEAGESLDIACTDRAGFQAAYRIARALRRNGSCRVHHPGGTLDIDPDANPNLVRVCVEGGDQ